MAPLNLSRVKLEDSLSLPDLHTKENKIKKENASTPIKLEPKIEISAPIQGKFISPSLEIKSNNLFTRTFNSEVKSKFRVNRRKRNILSSTSPMQRRPKLLTALRVHKYLTSKDPDTLSKRELDSLTWSELVLVQASLKREKYSGKEMLNKVRNPFAKSVFRTDSNVDRSISNNLQLEVVDFGSPDRRYTFERGKIIEKAFNKAVVDHILNKSDPTTPRYGLSQWRNGVLVLDCKDNNSYIFAQNTVNKIIPWRKAILRAIPPQIDNFVFIGKLHAPDIDIRKEDVIRVLESQNPMVSMQSWRVLEETAVQPGFKIYHIAITHPPAKLLENKYLKLIFGATELQLEFIKSEIVVS